MEEITLDTFDLKPTSDFGGGLEFLMNDKKKEGGKSEVSFSIEDELKEMEMMNEDAPPPREVKPIRLNFENTQEPIRIGRDTASIDTFSQSTSGFRHMSDIPVEEEIKQVETKSKEELLREKFTYLRKLEDLQTQGHNLSRHYTMESSLDEMKGEYEFYMNEIDRKASIDFQTMMLKAFITGVTYFNKEYNPFDIDLTGFSDAVNENIKDYDSIFTEIYEKYKGKAKMAPELSLIFRIATTGMTVHMMNTLFKSAMPNMDDIMRQNPDIANNFSNVISQSLREKAPGMANMMNEFGRRPSQIPRQEQPPVPNYAPRPQPKREEMSGPSNINHVLSGMGLNRKINLDDKNESIVSLEDVDVLSSSGVPAISKRSRRKSDKNRGDNRVDIII